MCMYVYIYVYNIYIANLSLELAALNSLRAYMLSLLVYTTTTVDLANLYFSVHYSLLLQAYVSETKICMFRTEIRL